MSETEQSDIKGYECRHVTYCPGVDGQNDLHVAKVYVHHKDGRVVPTIHRIKNFVRDFYITREGFRNHQDKKEFELISRLQRYQSTQVKLADSVSRALNGMPAGRRSMRDLSASPYLYGTDIASTALVKKYYETKWPECVSPDAKVAILDIETDVISNIGEIIVVTLSFKNRIVTALNSSFISRARKPELHIQALMKKHLGELMAKRGINFELAVFDSAHECCLHVIKRAHEWKPDLIGVWNLDFDLPKIMSCLEMAGKDLAQVFSDPDVPDEFKFFKYTQGKAQKVTQSGKVIPLHPADRWHTAECPASFYFIDAMCLYKRVRIAKGMEPSYALDDILKKHIGTGKLSIPEVDHLEKLAWHIAMQRDYPFDYVVYNVFDCIGVELLDEKTGDMAKTFPILCGNSDYRNFTSNPRRIVDDQHFFYLEEDRVIGTTGPDMKEDLDDDVIGMQEWIVTLRAHLIEDNGVAVIRELPSIRSMIRLHNADLDIEGTYPTEEEVMNIAKDTTLRELSDIMVPGLPGKNTTHSQEEVNEKEDNWNNPEKEASTSPREALRRRIGINLSGGVVNAVEIATTAMELPTPSKWVALMLEQEKSQ